MKRDWQRVSKRQPSTISGKPGRCKFQGMPDGPEAVCWMQTDTDMLFDTGIADCDQLDHGLQYGSETNE